MGQELARLFNPSSVAIIGASGNGQKGGGFLLKGLLKTFKGELYPVNPREASVMGLRSYPSILDIPATVDLAVIAVPAKMVPQVMAECGAKGTRFAVIHTAGFSESGSQGRELEDEVLRVARQNDIRVVGPNCMGLYCPRCGFNTVVPEASLGGETGSVAFVGQSGWASENFIEVGHERGLRFSKVISIGNQIDLSIEDFLDYFADDAETAVIACYIEGVKRGREFFRLAEQVSLKKPLVVWKGGRTEAGAKAASSHTGSLASNNAVFEAMLRQAGVTSAQNLEELVDLTIGFTCPTMPAGNRVGVLVESGAGAVIASDLSESLGLTIPVLSAEAQRELMKTVQGIIPTFQSRSNPVDLLWIPLEDAAEVFGREARVILKEVDAILIVLYARLNEELAAVLTSLRDEAGKPVFIVPGNAPRVKPGMSLLVREGIPTFPIPDTALKALAATVHYAGYRRRR